MSAHEDPDLAALPLDGLDATTDLPTDLEDRVVERLRGRGLLAQRPALGSRRTQLAMAASIMSAFLLGFAARSPDRPPVANYLLLLDGAAGGTLSPEVTRERVAEYGAWAGQLHDDGALVAAERLLPGAERIGTNPGMPLASGFFLLRAPDGEAARAIAEDCPHLRHGGSVTLQVIDGVGEGR